MTINEVWDAVNAGKIVNWINGLYVVHAVEYDLGNNEWSSLSLRGNKALRVTCEQNYFGSLITEQCLTQCFIKGEGK
jgi:hypothetical protein